MGLDLLPRHTASDRHRDGAAHFHAARRAVVPPPAVDPRLRFGPENGTPAMASDSQLTGTTSSAVMPIVRVAVLASGGPDSPDGGRVTDMALPTGLPLREILPAVRRMAIAGDDDDSTDAVQLSLAPLGGWIRGAHRGVRRRAADGARHHGLLGAGSETGYGAVDHGAGPDRRGTRTRGTR